VRLTAEAMDLPRHEVRAIVSAAAEIVGVDPPAWHNAFRNSPNRAKVVHTMGQAICLKITGGHLKRMGLEYGDECQIVYHPDSNTTEIIPEKNLTKRYDDPFELENQFSD